MAIHVSAGLPHWTERVLFYGRTIGWQVGHLACSGRVWVITTDSLSECEECGGQTMVTDSEVTHWQRLPDVPEGGR